jgi:hypothetical protein
MSDQSDEDEYSSPEEFQEEVAVDLEEFEPNRKVKPIDPE